ncbi:MAG: dipicolinate synthase subunit DpsA [Clostridia bacterium]|nr:dipicolinate synthase subunit DpsA [Clostridia bacterium]
MNKQIGIIGGDLRIIKLIEILENEGFEVYTYGLENNKFLNSNIVKCNTITELNINCNYIISGMPFSKDGIHIYAPFSNKKVVINDLLQIIENKTLIAGAIKLEIKQNAKKNNITIIDLMDIEELAVLNTIPTVEGAIQIAMQETEITIHNSNCLVLGFGRIGKLLTNALRNLGAHVYCMARKESDLAWIKTYGYNAIHINELEKSLNNKYDIIFNTIPALILDEAKLELIKNKSIIIELASNPGGIDFEKAKQYNIKVVKALGLPGKAAPYTSAKYIKQILDKVIF